MSETLIPPSPLQLRAELEEMVRLDLLGPAGGPHEQIDERNVRGRYIVGLLAPKGQTILPDLEDDLASGGPASDEDGKADTVVPQMASMLPSSIGLTFTVEGTAGAIQITARWGCYQRIRSETLPPNEKGEPPLVWQRRPVESVSPPIPLQAGAVGPWYPEPENEAVYVTGRCRRRSDAWSVTLFLVNAQQEPKSNKDEAWIFQPELIVEAPDGAPIFIKRQLPPGLTVNHDHEDMAMAMLYRRHVEFAVGHGVAVHAECATWQQATRLETRVMPTYEVEQMEPPTATDIPLLGTAVLDMKELAETEQGGFAAVLAPLAEAYESWIEEQATQWREMEEELASFQDSASTALENCREALGRIQAGIALLDSDPQAARAFQFANRAMHLQRVRSIYARQARQGQQPDLAAIDIPRNRSWRPFQLAFLLLNLPGLVDPTHPERSDPTQAFADLLWFPTGGGKTEAYLGVAAFAMGIRRLQGQMGDYSGMAGVTVLMRYTLRLLTLQQFQRAATLIAACEVIRREEPAVWGIEPFRIGLWVGQRSTPNWTKDAAEAIKQARNTSWGGGGGTPYQITNCPWCGAALDPGKHITVETYEQGRGRTFQHCPNGFGDCPFSRKNSPDEGIPIVVVDEEIYRRLPTLLIATVDKFAQMPWRGAAQMLFGRVNGKCGRHGYRANDLEELQDKDRHTKKGNLPAVSAQEAGPLRPPDLIIQDELHLISGPLGTLVGLYETAVDRLASWELNGQRVRPKVIASTATIRRARNQVNNLFLREVKIFPPAALDAGDNFFSRRRPSTDETPGRLYIGLCAPGTRLKSVLIRVYVAYMAAAQELYEKYGGQADPWMTLVGYFNSMRELGGMRRVMDDAVQTRLRQMDKRGLAKRFIDALNVEELTSRKGAADIPKILDRLETTFQPQVQENGRSRKQDPARRPIDAVLATNMISVGVDVSRLGLMVVAGQPKATAEYIQATSRVGRDRQGPGIVCTVYNWSRPRDLSHYERFEHYHATFYQQVEALSLTPFSPRALDRGLSGVLVSLLRLLGPDYNANNTAGQLDRQHPFVNAALEEISRRAERVTGSQADADLVRAMLQTRLDHWLAKAQAITGGAVLGYQGQRDQVTLGLLKPAAGSDWDYFTCLNSLRDVEPAVPLVLKDHGMDHEPGQLVSAEEEVA